MFCGRPVQSASKHYKPLYMNIGDTFATVAKSKKAVSNELRVTIQ